MINKRQTSLMSQKGVGVRGDWVKKEKEKEFLNTPQPDPPNVDIFLSLYVYI